MRFIRAACVTALLAPAAAWAQPAGLPTTEIERLTLNPSGAGSLILGTGELLPQGGYRISLTGHYEREPLSLFRGSERAASILRYRATGHMAAAVGLFNALELSAQLPVVLAQRGDDLSSYGLGQPAGGPAVGTPQLGLRLGLLAQRAGEPIDLALGVAVGLPVGDAMALARESSAWFTPSLMLGRNFGPVRAALDLGMRLRAKDVTDEEAYQGLPSHEVRAGAVLSTLGNGLRGELDLFTSIPLKTNRREYEALIGARLPLGRYLELYALVGGALGSATGTPLYRGMLGLAVSNELRHCAPGDSHRIKECPELDDDHDGVKNGVDACPQEGGKVDASGCPLRDADGDGVVDAQDRCPNEAGTAELQGCPPPPPPDTDGDGIPDAQDACPNEAGPDAGCPAKAEAPPPPEPEPAPKPLVELRKERIEIHDKVSFRLGTPKLDPGSHPLLNQVAKLILEHPEIERVSIEGHTDRTGSAAANQKLSLARADAVRDYLVSQGVAAERLETKGFGFEKPIMPNTTSRGRAANRRVEFLVRNAQGAP